MKLTIEEYKQHENDYDGYCPKCNDIGRYGGTEGDAENYKCEICGENTVFGMMNCLVMGLIEID